jgi:hypothetical protein
MTIGPFTTYSPPGVYVSTTAEANQGQILDGLRVPVIIGVAQETLTQTDIEIIRGSSSVADTPIFGEDPAAAWVQGGSPLNPILGVQDGNRISFRVRNYPIVDGDGVGRITNDVTKVSVSINGAQAVVSTVNGSTGVVTLLTPTAPTDIVTINYFFRRTDTRITDTLSSQVTVGAAALVTPKSENFEVITGTNDQLIVFVNDAVASVSIALTPGTRSASDVANDINVAAISGLTAQTFTDNAGLIHVQLNAANNIQIGSGTANGVLGFNPGDSTSRNRAFRVFQRPIVDGSDGGITTTEVSKVTVLVGGVQVIPLDVDGTNGVVTLQQAPASGAVVTIQYYFNTFQDTFDYLPNSHITSVSNVGISPGRRDFLNGADFIIENRGDQSLIQWGTAFRVEAGETTGVSSFDDTQVVGLLVDDRIFNALLTRFTDPITNAVSTTKFILPLKATTGNGRDTTLSTSIFEAITNGRIDLSTNRPDLIVVRAGTSLRDALSKPAIAVVEVDSSTNMITLKSPVSADQRVWATFWYNRIVDDTYTMSVVTPGPSGIGTYTVSSLLNNGAPLYQVRFGSKSSLPQTVQWPSGVEFLPDAFHFGGAPVSETVAVTFDTSLLPATHASIRSGGAGPYDIFTASGIFGGVAIDGNAPLSVSLSTAFTASLVSAPISSPGSLVFLSTDRLVLQIDGINITVDVSAATTLALVVTAINAAIDADVQVHADGSGTFLSTAPNALASAVTYATQSILKINGRNVKSVSNGLLSNVKVLTPTIGGQTDASSKVGLAPNQESVGSFNALNHAAEIVGTATAPFNIISGVDDTLLFNVDSKDVNAQIPAGTTVPIEIAIDAINNGYLSVASAAELAAALASGIALANEIKTDYNIHRVSVVFHGVADVTNVVAAANATDLATLITLANEIKVDLNAHYANAGGVYHLVPDTVNTVTTADATDLRSVLRLVSAEKASYNAHRVQAGVHTVDDTTNITTALLSYFVAFAGLGINLDKVILRSTTNSVSSVVEISALGTANDKLGFLAGDRALRVQPTAAAISAALNKNGPFAALSVAYPVLASGLGTFLRIDSLTVGSTSTLSFTSVASTAFVTGTGLGIVIGSTGDSGEAAQAGFSVTSSNPIGSSGTGTPGQTYTDARTGLRFSILAADAGDYANAGSFQLLVGSVFTADGGIPTKSFPGVEITVYNTNNMGIDTTALLTTFDKSGNEPAIGDVYNISYNFEKTDLSTRLFRDLRTIQANFGPPTPEFPLSLAARLALLNGAVLLGLKQVPRSADSSQAPPSAFIQAIDDQRKAIEGTVKPDIITPLSTSTEVFSFLNQHCVFMGSPRQEGERIGVVGVAAGTTPLGVRAIATGLQSELMIVNYPDTYIVAVTDSLGNSIDQAVDGTFMAAALAGASCNPAIDVATPWTRREILGFRRIGRNLDPTEANQVAVSGVSVIESINSNIRIRHGLTTRLDTVITRTPSVITTIQFVQQSIRAALDPYIGQKFTGSLIKAVSNTLTGLFSTLIDQKIVTAVSGINVFVDADDPTIMRVEAVYVPVFPLEYILSRLQIRTRA